MGTKYNGKETFIYFLIGGGTIDLTGDSREIDVDEQANEIDVTTRSDAQANAKAYLGDAPERKWSVNSLDTSGTAQAWDMLDTNDEGTLVYYPEGTAVGKRKRSATATVLHKKWTSTYNNAPAIVLDGRLNSAITATVVS